MGSLHVRIALFLSVLILYGQTEKVSIRIKLVDGRTGIPVKNEKIGLEDGTDYHDISVQTNDRGVASLEIRKDAVILVHNTGHYVNCADEL